jgi:hypothetical protein
MVGERMDTMAWIPRSPKDRYGDLVWLPRLLDKARRALEGQQRGVDLMTPYMYGDNDYLDAKLLAFLRVRDRHVLQIVAEEGDDAKAAELLVALSGRSPEECRRWSERFLKWEAAWIALIDFDEDRQQGGSAEAAKWFYNRVLFPPVFSVFRWMEGKRSTGTPANPPPAPAEGT